MSTHSQTQKRSVWINSFEILLFMVLLAWVVYSGVRLASQWTQFQGAIEDASLQSPFREVASLQVTPLETIETDCSTPSLQQHTAANKIRLSGPICGLEQGHQWIRTEVSNLSNHSTATVFGNAAEKRFSTDYVTLTPGTNALSIRFIYDQGVILTQTIEVTKSVGRTTSETDVPQKN